MALILPRPPQISTDPAVDMNAMGAIHGAFDLLEQRIPTFGTGTVTWSAATSLSDVVTVVHKLGFIPAAILLAPVKNSVAHMWVASLTGTQTAVSFDVQGYDLQTGTIGATGVLHWVAFRA